jgi:hypothetical protein
LPELIGFNDSARMRTVKAPRSIFHPLPGWNGLFFLLLLLLGLRALAEPAFRPGESWLDQQGQPIQAHGGGILVRSNVYYWFGEDRTPAGRGSVSCYSSTNLYDWTREGVALGSDALPRVDGRPTFVERPKVVFNARNGKYVMWMHLEQWGYHYARAGIATSDRPMGPFTFLKAIRPITNDCGFEVDEPNRQKQFGGTVRDFNLFVDDDSLAYAFYASENNWTMYVVRLDTDFTGPEEPSVEAKTWGRILVRRMREAPAPFKYRGRYYVITSACTGWKPNEADCCVAEQILGPYRSLGNPCRGADASTTFGAQSTFVLPVPGRPDDFILMADRWNPRRLSDSRYIWLPIVFSTGNSSASDAAVATIPFRERWDLTAFTAALPQRVVPK